MNDPTQTTDPADQPTNAVWTVPNLLSTIRLIGAFALIWVAYRDWNITFVVVFTLLWLSDWFDGKIAVLFHQRTELGARLDSFGDAAMYMALILGIWWLRPEFVGQHAIWIGVVLASYALTTMAGLIKFHRVPSYHTQGAKVSSFLVGVGVVILLAGGPVWPIRVAMTCVILTNVEATAITMISKQWRADVLTIYHAWRERDSRC